VIAPGFENSMNVSHKSLMKNSLKLVAASATLKSSISVFIDFTKFPNLERSHFSRSDVVGLSRIATSDDGAL